jgi:hypothetical protein
LSQRGTGAEGGRDESYDGFHKRTNETRRAARLDSTTDWRLAQAKLLVPSSLVPNRHNEESRNAGRAADETGFQTPQLLWAASCPGVRADCN